MLYQMIQDAEVDVLLETLVTAVADISVDNSVVTVVELNDDRCI